MKEWDDQNKKKYSKKKRFLNYKYFAHLCLQISKEKEK